MPEGKKNILLLTASVGSGHIKAAMAVADELGRLLPEASISMVDCMSRRVSIAAWLCKWIYLKMLRFVPNLYDKLYRLAGGKAGESVTHGWFSCVLAPALRKVMRRKKPDLVICTHPFPEGAAMLLKWWRPAEFSFPVAVVMTDYSLHAIWLYPGVNQYFMATEAMRQEMIARGFAAAGLYATGIPVSTGLGEQRRRRLETREQLGIAAGQAVVMLMGGGLGLGGIGDTLNELEQVPASLTVIVVAGHNAKLEQTARDFAARSRHQVLVYGYTEQATALMSASDLLITKPGALTISEALVLGVPLLLHDPIPGPETENAVYATRSGAAVWLHPGESLREAVSILLQGERLSRMSVKARVVSRPYAARDIATHLLELD